MFILHFEFNSMGPTGFLFYLEI